MAPDDTTTRRAGVAFVRAASSPAMASSTARSMPPPGAVSTPVPIFTTAVRARARSEARRDSGSAARGRGAEGIGAP